MKITRIWSMPSKWTFKIKPISILLKEEMDLVNEIWLDPFAGLNSPAQYRNDINTKMKAQDNEEALEWLNKIKLNFADGILLDPPYSARQASECYAAVGKKITGWYTGSGYCKALKDKVAMVIKPGGKVICFGWSSGGLGKNRGFILQRILLIPHGGRHNDTIVTVEIKKGKQLSNKKGLNNFIK